MPDDEFADVARQIEESLSNLNQVNDPTLRRKMLADMQRLIAEADRLAAESEKAVIARDH
jgi:hypothetical protein